jgi:hypothetical protein
MMIKTAAGSEVPQAVFLQPGLPSKLAAYLTQFATTIKREINSFWEWRKAL